MKVTTKEIKETKVVIEIDANTARNLALVLDSISGETAQRKALEKLSQEIKFALDLNFDMIDYDEINGDIYFEPC